MVIILKGKHKHPVPAGLRELIEAKLEEARFDTKLADWYVRHGPAVKGTALMPRFSGVKLCPEIGSVEIRVKPAENNTCRKCWIIPAKGHSLEAVFTGLAAVAD